MKCVQIGTDNHDPENRVPILIISYSLFHFFRFLRYHRRCLHFRWKSGSGNHLQGLWSIKRIGNRLATQVSFKYHITEHNILKSLTSMGHRFTDLYLIKYSFVLFTKHVKLSLIWITKVLSSIKKICTVISPTTFDISQNVLKQDCIPVWCVPSAAVAVGGGGVGGGGWRGCIPACTGKGGLYHSMHWAVGGGLYPSMHWAGGCVYPSMHWARGCLPGSVCPEGVSVQGGVCTGGVWPGGVCPRGCLPGGVSTWRVSVPVHAGIHTPSLWTEFLTHACEKITTLRTVINFPISLANRGSWYE